VPTETVVMALRGTEAPFRDAVLSSMASRARRLVESELSNGATPPQRDITKARRAIAELVLKMVQRNEIEIDVPDSQEAT
jgi:flagellar motor switch protein FliG